MTSPKWSYQGRIELPKVIRRTVYPNSTSQQDIVIVMLQEQQSLIQQLLNMQQVITEKQKKLTEKQQLCQFSRRNWKPSWLKHKIKLKSRIPLFQQVVRGQIRLYKKCVVSGESALCHKFRKISWYINHESHGNKLITRVRDAKPAVSIPAI